VTDTRQWRVPGPRLVAALAVLLACAACLPSLVGGFFADDFIYIVGNDELQSISLWHVWRFFGGPTNPYEFLPIRDLSYRLDIALFGLRPLGYHLHNVLLYALCGLAAWYCCRALLPHLAIARHGAAAADMVRDASICAGVTALFVAHPTHVESVAWVSGRKELLSGLFALISIGLFARAIRSESPDFRRLIAAHVLFALAIMSKSTALPVVLVALLLTAVRARQSGSFGLARAVAVTAPMATMSALWLWAVLHFGDASGVRLDPFLTEVAQSHWVETALGILGSLTQIAVAPFGLRLIYDIAQFGLLPVLLTGVLGLAAGLIGGVRAWQRGSAPGFAAAFFVIFCLPYLQLIPFTTWSAASERFLFLPVFGLALAVASLLARWGPATLRVGGTVLVTAGLALTLDQALTWRSTEDLIRETAERSRESAGAQMLLVTQVLVPAGRFAEAEKALARVHDPMARAVLLRYVGAQRALAAGDPDRARLEAAGLEFFVGARTETLFLQLVGRLAEYDGDDVEAARRYHQIERRGLTQQDLENARASLVRIRSRHAGRLEAMRERAAANPGDVVVQGNLANAELELFLLAEAEARYREILQDHPSMAVARYNLGLTLLRQERFRQASIELRGAIDDGMVSATAWNNLASALQQSGDVQAAEKAYGQALLLDPAHCHAAINLGRLHLAMRRVEPAKSALQSVRTDACRKYEFVIDLYLQQADRIEDL
jgi:Flp pilus assembly protein TadD